MPTLIPSFMRRVALHEWRTILVAMLLLAFGLGWQNGLGRMDQTLYDKFVSASGRVAREDIIIVAIDDYSLSELGKWPWSRTLHADLIQKINHANPHIIGLDVILSEPEYPQADGKRPGDLALENALRQNNRTVLPIVISNIGNGVVPVLPIPEFARAARAMGEINLEHDSDGVVRSVVLSHGKNSAWWPHFALALFDPDRRNTIGNQIASDQTTALWKSTQRVYIPFAGSAGQFQSVPYVSVLRGEVSDQFFAKKYVLIGATAAGMTDSYPTPVSGESGAMAGVEINANILASLLDHKSIVIAQRWQTACFSAVPVLLALLCYLLLAPRIAILAASGLFVLTIVTSFLALRQGLWLAPSAALITLVCSYPIWSWRRLEAAIAYLGQEFSRLDQEPHLLPEPASSSDPEEISDVLEQRINAMRNAASRVRDLRQFVSDSLDNLPDATLVTNTAGQIVLANRPACHYFASTGTNSLAGISALELLSPLESPHALDLAGNARFEWADLLDVSLAASHSSGIGVRDAQGKDLLIKSAPCQSARNLLTGWIISIIDISTIRAAERTRDETLRFLSHDMRAPQASILALLELQSEPSSALSQPDFFSRIEKASRKTLGLADNFVQLARAESHEYRLEEVDFQDILFDASDEMWTLARSKNIKLVTDIIEGEYPVVVDRVLMTRVLVNLLSNAINYSPENTTISWTLQAHAADSAHIVCRITDQGYGIAADDQLKLFQRFQRVDHADQPHHDGIGLGLVFVKTVVERHQGQITFSSAVGVGTTFMLMMPCHQANRTP